MPTTLPQLFEDQVRRTPDAPALVFDRETLTYRELDSRADTLAMELQALGVGPEVIVGLFAGRSLEMVIGLLGILKAGGAYLPIDTSSPPERVALMLEDARVPVLLTYSSPRARAPATGVHTLNLDGFDWTRLIRPAPRGESVHPNLLAYVMYTSGSTGRPKGVCVEHRNIVEYTLAVSARLRLAPGMRYAMVSTTAADLGHTVLFPSLTTGGCLHVISQARSESPAALEEYFTREQIDVLKITPSHLAALQTGTHPERVMPRQRLILGGEASRLDWIERVRALAPACEVFNHYGPTETTVGALTYRVSSPVPRTASGTLPLGTPLPHAHVYVVDTDGARVPVDVPGELWIGGLGVARGYLNRPDLTADRFVQDPFGADPGDRIYRTGDLARWLPDGSIEFCGRVDDQVKIRGYRVEPGEIQAALCLHGGVRDARVLAVDDDVTGTQLVAYVVPSGSRETAGSDPAGIPGPAELRAHLASRLPPHMIPSAFVLLKEFPLTPNGKVDRRALVATPVARPEVPAGSSRALTATEATLAGIWMTMLNVRQVRVDDNFFELGGHSLLAFRALARIREAFGLDVPLRALFEGPTLSGLAGIIDGLLWIAEAGPASASADGDDDVEVTL